MTEPGPGWSDGRFDADFIRRTYRSVAWVSAVVWLMLASYGLWDWLAGVAAGTLFSVAFLHSIEAKVRRLVVPEREGVSGRLAAVTILQYIVAAGLLYALYRLQVRLDAFAAGFVLVHLVMALKAVGNLLFVRSDR